MSPRSVRTDGSNEFFRRIIRALRPALVRVLRTAGLPDPVIKQVDKALGDFESDLADAIEKAFKEFGPDVLRGGAEVGRKVVVTVKEVAATTAKVAKDVMATASDAVKSARRSNEAPVSAAGLLAAAEPFASLVDARLRRSVATTEDSIRYLFFAAAVERGVADPTTVVLEMPSAVRKRTEIDAFIPDPAGGRPWVLEFKYYRRIPSGRNAPRTQLAGKLFNDMLRLVAHCAPLGARALFVCLVDDEMAGYLHNPANVGHEVFLLPEGGTFAVPPEYFVAAAPTFLNNLSELPTAFRASTVLSRAVGGANRLWVIEVAPFEN